MAVTTSSSALPQTPLCVYTPQRRAPATPAAMVRAFWTNRDLLWQMTRREVVGRYRGSLLGLAWSFFHPLLLLGAYTFAFSYVMKIGRGPASGVANPLLDFAIYAFSGLILLGLVAEVATRAPGLILQNTSYVKRVVFPLEIFPLVELGAAAIHAAMSLLVLLLALALVRHGVPWTVLLAPVVVLPLALMILGFAWMLAALGVYLRDVSQVISIVIMMLMYLSPVFYKLNMIDAPWIRSLIQLNPLTIPLLGFRRVMLEGAPPEWAPLGLYTLASLAIAWLGFASFQRSRRGFADVL